MPPLPSATTLRRAADRLERVRRVFVRGEDGLRKLRRSRVTFINSLRHTGLSYAQACAKFERCLDEQQRAHQQNTPALRYAERHYLMLCEEMQQKKAA
jgi:hypothetical protein